ncbi:MAG TPA: hypothetical protein VGQ72_03005 [Pyrinomonadaceae bacterium]|nr:hypothetical protein [Pyrinomonadaceae bacterium]
MFREPADEGLVWLLGLISAPTARDVIAWANGPSSADQLKSSAEGA